MSRAEARRAPQSAPAGQNRAMRRTQPATFTELTEGKPFYPMSGRKAPDLAGAGYEASEWAMAGEATSCSTDVVPTDGRVALVESDTAPFATRVLVHRPRPEKFSGVVLVEWLNVSGGQDAAPEWTYVAEEVMRAGHAWIGVSAQYIAVQGGDAAVGLGGQTAGLRSQRPQRYGDLHHPGDAFSYDIFTQVGRFVRELAGGDGNAHGPLGDLSPTTVIAIGESQSAFALTSYVNGVHPLAGVFDGFFLHSRGAGALAYNDHGRAADITAALTSALESGAVRVRDDLTTPVLLVQAEGDLTHPLYSLLARQPDTEHVVTWEIAGQAHADTFQLGEFAQFVDCGDPINNGQQVFVLRAALRHLVTWVGGGSRPVSVPRIEMDDDDKVVPGDLGIGRGGVRTPAVEAPVERLIGAPAMQAEPICMLLGRTIEVAEAELRERWPSREDYLDAYREATDRLIGEGFLLTEDREEILADARPERITW